VLTWDEHLYARLAPVRAGQRAASGVIWLTDADASSRDVRRRVALLRRADALWCLSEAQIDPLRALVGPAGPPVHHVTFGIDAEFYSPADYPERPVVVSAGGDRHRDVGALLDALGDVARAVPDAEIVVQGRSDRPPPPGVRVVERLSHVELRDLYRRMSVLVVATRPNLHVSGMTVSLEARATGRPVVITRTPGMYEYVQDGETGHVVATQELAEATISLLRDPRRARSYGVTGRRRVEERFTTRDLCRRLAGVVEQMGDA